MTDHVPCRLYLLMAREANIAIILRRGPSKWYQIIKWDTDTDRFEDGAWFHGRIHEHACDVSPDGKWFVYFASKYDRQLADTEYGYNWTAVSRTPWLFALGLWPSADGGYPGGGRFLANNHLCILNSRTLPTQHPDHRPPRELTIEQRSWNEFQDFPSTDFADAQWVGQDQFGRTVIAHDGKLFRHQDGEVVQLIDLNHREPDPQPAPIWARHK